MRTSLVCPKCHHEEILFVPRLTDFQHSTVAAQVEDRWSSTGSVIVRGALEAHTCRACGFTELYMREPRKVDPAKVSGAKVLRRASQGPYR